MKFKKLIYISQTIQFYFFFVILVRPIYLFVRDERKSLLHSSHFKKNL